MSRFLPSALVAILFLSILATYTFLYCMVLILFGLLGRLGPGTGWEHFWRRARIALFVSWAWTTRGMYYIFHHTNYQIRLPENLNRDEWYMIVSNHTSWADIPLLIAFLQRDLPQLAFFLKKQLIWVPIVGWVALFADMPFMERYSRAYLKKHPEKRGKDLEATRQACAKFDKVPVALINFLEGTRFTAVKQARQDSPYGLLLKPKSGGFAYALSSMDGKMKTVLDISLVYSGPKLRSFMDQLGGKADIIVVDGRLRDVPAGFQSRDYENDMEFRAGFQAWVNELWKDKEARILDIKREIGDDPQHSYPWPSADHAALAPQAASPQQDEAS